MDWPRTLTALSVALTTIGTWRIGWSVIDKFRGRVYGITSADGAAVRSPEYEQWAKTNDRRTCGELLVVTLGGLLQIVALYMPARGPASGTNGLELRMCDLPGINGALIGLIIFATAWLVAYLKLGDGPFRMDPDGVKGDFLPLLTIYMDVVKVILGLASASIVALVGSAIIATSKSADWKQIFSTLSDPLCLLGLSIISGAVLMLCINIHYEAYRHGRPYTRFKYSWNLACGIGCLACFAIGYAWLIVAVIAHTIAR